MVQNNFNVGQITSFVKGAFGMKDSRLLPSLVVTDGLRFGKDCSLLWRIVLYMVLILILRTLRHLIKDQK